MLSKAGSLNTLARSEFKTIKLFQFSLKATTNKEALRRRFLKRPYSDLWQKVMVMMMVDSTSTTSGSFSSAASSTDRLFQESKHMKNYRRMSNWHVYSESFSYLFIYAHQTRNNLFNILPVDALNHSSLSIETRCGSETFDDCFERLWSGEISISLEAKLWKASCCQFVALFMFPMFD